MRKKDLSNIQAYYGSSIGNKEPRGVIFKINDEWKGVLVEFHGDTPMIPYPGGTLSKGDVGRLIEFLAENAK